MVEVMTMWWKIIFILLLVGGLVFGCGGSKEVVNQDTDEDGVWWTVKSEPYSEDEQPIKSSQPDSTSDGLEEILDLLEDPEPAEQPTDVLKSANLPAETNITNIEKQWKYEIIVSVKATNEEWGVFQCDSFFVEKSGKRKNYYTYTLFDENGREVAQFVIGRNMYIQENNWDESSWKKKWDLDDPSWIK